MSVTFYRRAIGGTWTDPQPIDTRLCATREEAAEIARRFRARYNTSIMYQWEGVKYYVVK